MESRPSSAEASAALIDAEASRTTLAGNVATPSWFFASLGVAIGVQIAATAVELGGDAPWLVAAGVVVFAAVAGVQLVRFRQVNGVWLGGFASRVVLGTGTATSLSYAVAAAAAILAAYGDHWRVAALWSAPGGAAYALNGRRWIRSYRADPAGHARGESLAWLALLTAAALGGLALLVLDA